MPITRHDPPHLDTQAQMFGLLSDPTRLRILFHLAGTERASVGELCRLLGKSQPVTSNALTLLRLGGLVSRQREGKSSLYRLDGPLVRDLLRWFRIRQARGWTRRDR